MRKKSGFTLVEIMMAVAIAGILFSLSALNYRKSVATARGAEARTNLNKIFMAEKAYFAYNNSYWGTGTVKTAAQVNAGLGTDVTARYFTDFTIDGDSGINSLSIIASGAGQSKSYTISSSGQIRET